MSGPTSAAVTRQAAYMVETGTVAGNA
jgi:hypothetical protein